MLARSMTGAALVLALAQPALARQAQTEGMGTIAAQQLPNEARQTLARIEAGLDSAASFLRRRLAHELTLRRMPELRFRFDPSLALGSETLRVLKEIEDDEST